MSVNSTPASSSRRTLNSVDERSSSSSSEEEEEWDACLAQRAPNLSLIPPSPQLDSAAEHRFWQGRRHSLDWNTKWSLSSGNVFWGFHRQRRRPFSGSAYGAVDAPASPHMPGQRALGPVGFRSQAMLRSAHSQDSFTLSMPSMQVDKPRTVLAHAFRPTGQVIDSLLESGPRRVFVLACIPVLLALCWCGVPFPAGDMDDRRALNAMFWFFLLWYFGMYMAVALIHVTQLFTLYRLNWWPDKIGARTSYTFFWALSLLGGYLIHRYTPRDQPGTHTPHANGQQWQLKSEWVLLTFATMSMPAFVCLIGLRRRGRQRYLTMLTDAQKPFVSGTDTWRIPASYRRFLWFMGSLSLSLITLLAGQGYTIVYMNTLPHTGIDGTLYVAFWMLTVHILSAVVQWIMSEKVRSRALLFACKFYYFMVYFIFYRNLFVRLRSFDQFALIQLLSSTWVCVWYPFCMSKTWLNVLNRCSSRPIPHHMHVEKISLYFYLRTIAQHTTMLAFLGWLSILHFGINQPLYPFFSFDDDDPYNYRLTVLGSLAIWTSETLFNIAAASVRRPDTYRLALPSAVRCAACTSWPC